VAAFSALAQAASESAATNALRGRLLLSRLALQVTLRGMRP